MAAITPACALADCIEAQTLYRKNYCSLLNESVELGSMHSRSYICDSSRTFLPNTNPNQEKRRNLTRSSTLAAYTSTFPLQCLMQRRNPSMHCSTVLYRKRMTFSVAYRGLVFGNLPHWIIVPYPINYGNCLQCMPRPKILNKRRRRVWHSFWPLILAVLAGAAVLRETSLYAAVPCQVNARY